MKPFGKRITRLREDRGLTPAEAAQRIGVSLATYKRWESGLASRGLDNLIKIACFYSVTTDFILGITHN